MNRQRPSSDPKFRSTCQACPNCGAPRIDQGSSHGFTKAGLPWAGQYDLFECGLLVMFRFNRPEMFHPCDKFLEGINRANGQDRNERGLPIIDIDEYTVRELTPAELAQREYEREMELALFIGGGRHQYVRSWFSTDSNTTGTT